MEDTGKTVTALLSKKKNYKATRLAGAFIEVLDYYENCVVIFFLIVLKCWDFVINGSI